MPEKLEHVLRGLVRLGELSHLSIIPVAGKNGEGGTVFAAHFRPASSKYREGYARDPDPVKALLDAIRNSSLPAKKMPDAEVDELLS